MNKQATRLAFIQTAALLLVALMVYAAVSKIIDFENFRVQIGQSPMLSAFAGWIAVLVPAVELLIAAFLLIPKTRVYGLIAAFSLMTMFSAYIFIILNFGSYVPCSCGGVLEKMGWKEHLVFNLFFVLLSLVALMIELRSRGCSVAFKPMRCAGLISGLFAFSVTTVATLYLLSEDIIHHRNNFTRRYTAFSEPEKRKYDLKSQGYYFAGIDKGTIYLGNTLAPRHLLVIDTTFKKPHPVIIELDRMDLPFHSVSVRIAPPYFFVTDGTIPAIFRGKIGEWKAKLMTTSAEPFSHAEPIDSVHLAVRGIRQEFMRNELAVIDLARKDSPTKWKPHLLIPQNDGIFDTDGVLLKNTATNRFHYIYYYRNEYFEMDSALNLIGRAHTIDTVHQANLKVVYLKDRRERKLAEPPLVVNKTAAAYRERLFVNSQLIGRFEDEQMWNQSSIIDVYDTANASYRSSFYVYHIGKKKMQSFLVYGNTLYALSGTWLSAVPLDPSLFRNQKTR